MRHVNDSIDYRALARFAALSAAIALFSNPLASAESRSATAAVGTERPGSAAAACPALLDHTFNRLQTGEAQSLCQYRGKVVLIVNTASYCGYTYQYEALEALYRRYKDRGLVVIGFPSNEFGSQEPKSNHEIAEFCRTTYGIEFPMYEKTTVKRFTANPVYSELIAKTGEAPRWNFHKYLVDRSGQKIRSFATQVEPDDKSIIEAIEQLLAEPAGAAAG